MHRILEFVAISVGTGLLATSFVLLPGAVAVAQTGGDDSTCDAVAGGCDGNCGDQSAPFGCPNGECTQDGDCKDCECQYISGGCNCSR